MKSTWRCTGILFLVIAVACSSSVSRGIADKRSSFTRFIPMTRDPAREGLKEVKPYFRHADRSQVLRAIERACANGRAGSSVYDETTGAGYYVNCNPSNRQLLNGYVPSNPREEPHSH